MSIKNYSKVKLLTDAYSHEGVGIGSIGYVIEIYENEKYEVEFSDQSGISIAQIVVNQNEIYVCEE